MARIGIAVVGTKGMGRGHIRAIEQTPGFELRAVCDVIPSECEAASRESNVPGYLDHKEMLKADKKIKAVAIATPHWFHPQIAVDCAKRKVHVLTEKPMSVMVGGADRMIAAHKKSKTVLAVVYQHRFGGVNAKARQIVQSGKLGKIHRVMLLAPGYRTNAYYASGAWRATWKGEGGGVLLNQAPHDLDQIQWITGMMPNEIYAISESALHPIEVEDRASALLRYANGAVGYIHVSTTELPGGKQIEVAGDRGKLLIQGGSLRWAKIKGSISKFTRTTKEAWGRLDCEWTDVPFKQPKHRGHVAVFRDFHQAITKRRKPVCTGEDGRNSVELANAMILSSFAGAPTRLPVNRTAYKRLMDGLIAKSRKRGGNKAPRRKK